MEQTSVIESAGGHQIHLQRQVGQHAGEIKLACRSEQRAMKDQDITVLAYQAVQVIRRKIKEYGINESWATL